VKIFLIAVDDGIHKRFMQRQFNFKVISVCASEP
jgi:hypothetical protein